MKYKSKCFTTHSEYCRFLEKSDIEIVSVNMVKPELGVFILVTFFGDKHGKLF
jgi:hypothetical protein